MFEDKKIELETVLLRLRGDLQSLRMFLVDHVPPCSEDGQLIMQQLTTLYTAIDPLYQLAWPRHQKE